MATALLTAAARTVEPERVGAQRCVHRGPIFFFDAAAGDFDRSVVARAGMAAPALAVMARAAAVPSATCREGCSGQRGGAICTTLFVVDSAMPDTHPVL